MKTKEEILESAKGFISPSTPNAIWWVDCLKAMQTYADQETAELLKVISDRNMTIADLTRKLAECERKNPT